MKKAVRILLKVGKILDIIAIVGLAIGFVGCIIGAVTTGATLAQMASSATDEEIAALTLAVSSCISGALTCAFYLAFVIVGIVFIPKISNALENSKTKAEAKKMAIAAIVTGVLTTEVVAVAGILMLCMKDEQYQNN